MSILVGRHSSKNKQRVNWKQGEVINCLSLVM